MFTTQQLDDKLPVPLFYMAEGSTAPAPSESGHGDYTITRFPGSYMCSCPAWAFKKGRKVYERSCKHLKGLLGNEYEIARIALFGHVEAPAKAPKVKKPKKAKVVKEPNLKKLMAAERKREREGLNQYHGPPLSKTEYDGEPTGELSENHEEPEHYSEEEDIKPKHIKAKAKPKSSKNTNSKAVKVKAEVEAYDSDAATAVEEEEYPSKKRGRSSKIKAEVEEEDDGDRTLNNDNDYHHDEKEEEVDVKPKIKKAKMTKAPAKKSKSMIIKAEDGVEEDVKPASLSRAGRAALRAARYD